MARTDIDLPRLGARGWIRWAWRRLTSMPTALMLLMLLAVAAVPGSVFPQRRIDPAQVDQYLSDNPTSGPWLDRLGAFDVYASPWFSAVYLLLFVSLVGCVVPRSRLHWRAVRAAPPAAPRRLERMPAYARAHVAAPPDEVLAAARTALRRRRYRRADGVDGDTVVSVNAERGYAAETGNLVFHLALLALLVGVAAGSFLSYSGQAIVVVGQTWANTLPGYDSFAPGRAVDADNLPPFSLSLDRLDVQFEKEVGGNQFGAPRDFEAALTVRTSPGADPEPRILRVNKPLDVGGTRMFLVGNGYAPVITVRDGGGQVAYSGPVPFRPRDANYNSSGVVKVADARPQQLGLRAFLIPTYAPGPDGQPFSVFPDADNPRLIFNAWTGDLGLDTGTPQSVYVLDTTKLTQLTSGGRPFEGNLAVGQTATLPDGAGTVTFEGLRRYAALDIRSDPTKLWVLAAATLSLAGLILSLFVRRRRVWVRAAPAPGDSGEVRTLVEVGGLSRSEDARLADEVAALLAECTGSAGDAVANGPAERVEPAERPPVGMRE